MSNPSVTDSENTTEGPLGLWDISGPEAFPHMLIFLDMLNEFLMDARSVEDLECLQNKGKNIL